MVYPPIQEYQRFEAYTMEQPDEKRFSKIASRKHPLLKWTNTPSNENAAPGYYASYNIGAQWINKDEAIVVTTKAKMESIDFVKMFMSCFNSSIATDEFNKIYEINVEESPIEAPSLRSVVSPLIVIHFLSIVSRIKSLKKGYIHRSENLKKVKGHINILKNERLNIMPKRYDRIYCEYDEYSIDIPENRLIKKALLFAKQVVLNICNKGCDVGNLRVLLAKDMVLFEQVSSDVEIRDIKQIKGHKLYTEYKEAIRLAKLILRHFDYNIRNVNNKEKVVPFVIDMSLLYEHYVLGLLREAYGDRIIYQFVGEHDERPDFLYCSMGYKAILDTKYIPRFEDSLLDIGVIRQLSGYGRDLKVLKKLGYYNLDEYSPVQDVPCIIIYPTEGKETYNPFRGKNLKDLCDIVKKWSRFYKINVPLPTITQ